MKPGSLAAGAAIFAAGLATGIGISRGFLSLALQSAQDRTAAQLSALSQRPAAAPSARPAPVEITRELSSDTLIHISAAPERISAESVFSPLSRPAGLLERVDLRSGDQIVGVNRMRVSSPQDAFLQLQKISRDGEALQEIIIRRDGRELTFKAEDSGDR